MVVVAQLVRAPDCGSGGRGFESHLPPFVLKKNALPDRRAFFVYLFIMLCKTRINCGVFCCPGKERIFSYLSFKKTVEGQ